MGPLPQDALSVPRLASLFRQLDVDGDGQASPLELLGAAEAARLGLATKDVEVALEAQRPWRPWRPWLGGLAMGGMPTLAE